jgi:hypothetical protein
MPEFELASQKPVTSKNLSSMPNPVVKWKLPGGGTQTTMVERHDFKIEERDKVLASRKQV